jgi:hypothetical protein
MTKPGYVSIYAAGETLLLAPMAGWGGGYKEMAGLVTHKLGEAGLEKILAGQLDRSDLRPDAFDRPSIARSKTGYAKAAAIAKRGKVTLRGFRFQRDEGGELTLQRLGPVKGSRGLGPDGREYHPQDLAHAAAFIRAALEEDQ